MDGASVSRREASHRVVMTLPTRLTLLRIVITFVIMGLLFVPGWISKCVALLGFMLAGATDWLDGYLARRWHQTSELGALLDPIADKVLVLGLFLAFVQLRLIPAWIVLIIVLRELVITGVRLFAAGRGLVLAAAREGKHKTVSQMATIMLVLTALIVEAVANPSPGWRQAAVMLHWAVAGCLWVTVVLTVYSGARFFGRHWVTLRDAVTKS